MKSLLVKYYPLVLALLLSGLFYFHLSEIRSELTLLDGIHMKSKIAIPSTEETSWVRIRHSIDMNLNVLFALLGIIITVLNIKHINNNNMASKRVDDESTTE